MTKIDKITTCCQKVLPLVYDESLSYYEVLCKVQQKLNELIKINNNIRDEIHKEYVEILETAKTVTEAVASVTSMRDEVLTLKQATEQYANDVVTVYNETVQARDTAIAKAEIAEQSATTATEKANIAQTSATTATEKAEIAVTNADIAKNNADKVITAMSLVAGTVNYYDSGTTPWVNRIYFADNISVYQSLNAFIRNNILYLVISLQLRYTGAGVYKLPDLLTVELSLNNTKLWSNSKLKNIDWANLPIVSYGGTNSEVVGDLGTCFSKAGGHSVKGTELPSYPVQLQVFNNDITQFVNDSGKSTDFTFNFTVAQPLKFVNEETPTPTDYIAKLDEEKQAREQADATLQQNIDTLSNDVFHKNDIVPIANGGTAANNEQRALINLTANTLSLLNELSSPTDRCSGNFRITVNGYLGFMYITSKIIFQVKQNDNGYILFQTLNTNTNINSKRYRIGSIQDTNKAKHFIEYQFSNGVLNIYIYIYMAQNDYNLTFEPNDNQTFPLIIY